MIEQVLRTVLIVPVIIAEGDAPDVSPLTIERDGHSNVVAFVTAESAKQVEEMTPYTLTMSGTSLVLRMADGVGLLLFSELGNVAFEPSLLAAIRADMRALADESTE